jgi:CHAD domain-containing protein
MLFSLQSFEPLSVGIRRLVGEQLAGAVRHLLSQAAPAGEGSDPVEAIHETRKCLKRVRTILRLARRALGRSQAQAINLRLRDVGQALSPYRDRQMLTEAIARLAKQTASSPFAEALAPVQTALSSRHPPMPLPEELLQAIVPTLRTVAATLDDALLKMSESKLRVSLRAGLRRMLRRGGRAYFLAYSEPSDENFHAYRKRVKDVYYTACLLHPTRPQRLSGWVDLLDALSEDLGDEHDLGILATVLHEQPIADSAATTLTLQLIARRRQDLRATARVGGGRLYQRSAKDTTQSMTRGLSRKKPPPGPPKLPR